MKTKILFFILLCLPFLGNAQEIVQDKPKQKEVGIIFANLNNFGITYRIGNAPYMWRFRSLIFNGDNYKETGDVTINQRSSIGGSLNIGREKRKVIAENFEFRYGVDIGLGIFEYKQESKTSSTNHSSSTQVFYEPTINAMIGLNYVVKDRLVIGAEILPSFTYSTGMHTYRDLANGTEEKTPTSGFRYGLTNGSALVSILYRY